MPLYEYQCDACGQRFEVIQKFSDDAPDACRKCGKGPVHRQQSSPAFQFKGSGWYVTDYAQKSKGDSGTGTGSDSDKPSSSSDGKASEAAAKTESTPKTDAPAASSTPSPAAKE